MKLVVFRSYLQRPKDVVFEGLSEIFGYGSGGEKKKKMKKKKSVERSWRIWKQERE